VSLQKADRPIDEVISYFSRFGLEAGLLVPTATGLQKSIMDAHSQLRDYLTLHKVHDYREQPQGPQAKVLLRGWLVSEERLTETTVSLYRPETKNGDPRIWVSGLPGYAQAGNLLALIAADGGLYVVNASDRALMQGGLHGTSPLGRLLARLSSQISPVASELLGKLRDISARGFIPTMKPGPTGIGYTLESLLGIAANSNKAPDYKGVELKAGRVGKTGLATTRSTLFSKVPDWDASPYTAKSLIEKFGQSSKAGRRQIYCEIGNVPNPTFGFYLKVEDTDDVMHVRRGTPKAAAEPSDEKLLQWDLTALRDALVAKHPETFWVKTATKGKGPSESFHYLEVEHTTRPLAANFGPLVNSGHVELDIVMHLKPNKNGGERVRDHGYLFKMWAQHRHLLFAVRMHKL
jgi:hypothetical protein